VVAFGEELKSSSTKGRKGFNVSSKKDEYPQRQRYINRFNKLNDTIYKSRRVAADKSLFTSISPHLKLYLA
jgi:hypothetical protein